MPQPDALATAVYHKLRTTHGAAAERFERWRAEWEAIHGAPGRKRRIDTRPFAARYGVAGEIELPRLLYVIEACFVLRMRAAAHTALAAARGVQPAAPDPADLLSARHFEGLGLAGYDAELFDISPLLASDAASLAARAIDAAAAPTQPDELRAAYHRLLPKQARHGLGAVFTPPWLAQYVVERVRAWLPAGHAPRLIDPACGAGTFLLAAMRAQVEALAQTDADPVRAALAAAVGLDINPVAVHAAQTSVLLFVAQLAAERGAALPDLIELPVFRADGLIAADGEPPALAAPFDAVVGNPPWVNWEHLPPAERERTRHLWAELGLFELRGQQKAFSKEDIAALFTAAAARRFLRDGGLLGFVLPQSLFKSSINGRGFRRLRLGPGGPPLEALRVDDLVDARPFDGVGGRPAVLFLRRGAPTAPPVPYHRWRLDGGRRSIPEAWSWPEVRRAAEVIPGWAAPIDPSDPGSAWTDAALDDADLLSRLSGASAYRARAGMFTGGANAVFYVELIEELPGGNLRVRNLRAGARRGVPSVEAEVEPTFVFPLLRGREVGAWSAAPAALVICPHTAASRMAAVPPDELRATAPLTLAYLEQFRDPLAERRGFVGWEQRFREAAFYACQRIGEYTFAPYKLVWRYIAPEFRCAVVGPGPVGTQAGRPVIPHEKLMLIGFDDPDEAHFVCGVLSSTPARRFIHSRMVETQIAPHVISRLALPRYQPGRDDHRALAGLSRAGHRQRAAGDEDGARRTLAEVDACAAAVLPAIKP